VLTRLQEDKAEESEDQLALTNCFAREITKTAKKREKSQRDERKPEKISQTNDKTMTESSENLLAHAYF